jgi:hypothetical protein
MADLCKNSSGIGAQRESPAMASIGGNDTIFWLQHGSDTDGYGLLPDAGMERTLNMSISAQTQCCLFEAANEQHLSVCEFRVKSQNRPPLVLPAML